MTALRTSFALRPAATTALCARPNLRANYAIARLILITCLSLAGTGFNCSAAGSEVRLGLTNMPDGVEISWVSQSITPTMPFVHYEFQIQESSNLVAWQNIGVPIAGGFLNSEALRHTYSLLTTNAQSFVRLNYRLNMPGADLSGLDLSGADLRGANLAGANLAGTHLDGALLGGADLTGANLSGATFAQANLQDVNLDGFDLTGIDLSTIQGTPLLTQITANAAGDVAGLLPALPYNSDARDIVTNDPNMPGFVSARNAMVMLKTNVTVSQFNALLARHGASIVASGPRDAFLPNAVLMMRFPTTSAQELSDLTLVLNNDPIVAAAAPDVLMGTTLIPNETGAAADWLWDMAGVSSGGNWGLEYARVPQMWNLLGALNAKGTARVPTCIIDVYFDPTHEDLSFTSLIGSPPVQVHDHGNHVAGIAGATFANRKGIDGVNPLVNLIGYTFRATSDEFPLPNLPSGSFEPGRQANAYSMVQDVRDALRLAPDTRIINMSLGYNWYLSTNALRPTITTPFTAEQLGHIEFIAGKYGLLMASVAYSASSVLIVCAAGNDFNLIPARLASPMCTAALDWGAGNILVVESHGPTGGPSGFSNRGGHVAAPGENILSAAASGSGAYTSLQGTSMASPFVAGLAGFLMAVDSGLDPATVIELVQAHGPNADAFTSLMEIDNLPGHDREVLRMQLDLDDRSLDGSRRVLVPPASLNWDRSFELVIGPDFTNDVSVIGDGRIDMSDFRRWRDWLVFSEGRAALNGSGEHPGLDGNGNGTAHPHDDMFFFPRGDFNGDGQLDQNSRRSVAGWFGDLPFTDLGVLMSSGLWEDTRYPDALGLSALIDSADFHVSAENFFTKNTDIDAAGSVSVYHAGTKVPISQGSLTPFSPASPVSLFTVPVGAEYYVASEPIDIGNGTNVQMRSIGEIEVASDQRGADFVVDLSLVEMTAVAETENPPAREIDSQPDEEEVDAYLSAGAGGSGTNSVGARAWANDQGTFYALARAGGTSVPPPDENQGTTFSSAVRWQRSFIKDATQADPTFEVKPMVLRLAGSGPNGTEMDAFAEIVVEMRAYDISPGWQPVFLYHAEIAGKAALGGNPSTFRIVGQEGDLPPKTLTLDGDFSAEYVQEKHKGTIDLDGVQDGHSFEVRYRLFAKVIGNGLDNEASAYIGDPLDYGSGMRMAYGSFGEWPYVIGYTNDNSGDGHVAYFSRTNFYYLLYRGTNVDTAGAPIAVKLGQNGVDEMIDPSPPVNAGVDSYTVENRPLTQPLDVDGDGIDDVFELLRPAILNPLDPSDALADADGDGRTNLREYLDGTDPAVVDGGPVQLYPALLFAASGDQIGDVNNDDIVDLIGNTGDGLAVSLGQPDHSFLAPIQSTVPNAGFSSSYTLAKVNADAFLDALVVDQTGNSLQVMLGNGTGSFSAGQQYTAGNRPDRVIAGDVNGDGVLDAVLVNRSGWMITVLLGDGDGTFEAPINTDTVFTPTDVVVAKLNADNLPDIAVTLANHTVAVFPGNGNGTFGTKREFSTSFSPQRVASGDLNGDGRADIITANQTSDGVSVLLGNGDGTLQAKTDYATGDNPREFKLADLDGDTDLDLVVGHFGADYHAILLNNGSGAFTAQTPAFTYNDGNCLLADFNRDGMLDLLSSVNGEAFFSFGLPGAKFDTRSQVIIPRMGPRDFELADINADGWTDVVIANVTSNTVEIAYGQPGGRLVPSNSVPIGRQVTALTVAALNHDGVLDLAVVTERPEFPPAGSSNQLHILHGNGAGGFVAQAPITLADRPGDVLAGDLNGDGRTDLLVIHFFIDSAAPFLGQADGSFTSAPLLSFGGRPNDYVIRDLNGDGRVDLVARVFVATDSRYRIYLADAAGALVLTQEIIPDASGAFGEFTFHDFTGDGRADLVASVADENGTHLFSYTGNSDGSFGSPQTVLDDFGFGGPIEVADVNADGRVDLISGSTLRLARGGGGFETPQTYWLPGTLPIRVRDFNGDQLPDLITANDSGDSIQILLHR